ncbi:MAG: 4a-hydroxytetrahydrobiopterin dehydratase [Paraperlucidibaca sp.]
MSGDGVWPEWQVRAEGLHIALRFAHFDAVHGFITELMAWAQRNDHHPEVSFGYAQATVTWFSHDAKAITERDYRGARATQQLMITWGATVV